jgi:hypothetical protein
MRKVTLLLALPMALAASACSSNSANEIENSAEATTDTLGNLAEDAGDTIGNAADDVGTTLGNAADDVGNRAATVGAAIENAVD